MIHSIFDKIWYYSTNISEENSYNFLVKLTQELLKLYEHEGRLSEDPFESASKRTLSLPFKKTQKELKDKVCLVTGGLGCVGNTLVQDLLRFDVSRIIILDIKPNKSTSLNNYGDKVKYIKCDIRDKKSLKECLNKYQPEIVFHTAAIRDPGYAEKNILETIETNIIGTWNLVNACEKNLSVKNIIFSSTGKASRYLTTEIYAATKKICENILDTFSRTSTIRYSMVRFTHIYCNSLMNNELKTAAKSSNYVRIHSPGKFVTAQNLNEASYLMLNGLKYTTTQKCNFLLVKNLEWPVESLEIALYYIKKSGRKIPLIFSGNPKGYSEKFFRGQLDWTNPHDLNLLINVYENQKRKINSEGDIIISEIIPCQKDTLFDTIQNLKSTTDTLKLREILLSSSKKMLEDSLHFVKKKDTFQILNWGISPKYLDAENTKLDDYKHIYPILINSLKGSTYFEEAQKILKEAKEYKH